MLSQRRTGSSKPKHAKVDGGISWQRRKSRGLLQAFDSIVSALHSRSTHGAESNRCTCARSNPKGVRSEGGSGLSHDVPAPTVDEVRTFWW